MPRLFQNPITMRSGRVSDSGKKCAQPLQVELIFNNKVPRLMGQCHKFFAAGFFRESVFPQPQSIPLGPFQIFPKIRGGYSQVKVHHRYTRHRRHSCASVGYIDGKFATSVNDTGGKFTAGSNDTSGKFATEVSDTCGK